MSTEGDVRKASDQFYAALNRMLNGDATLLTDVWSHSASVTAMHPIGGRQVGWDDVRTSWQAVARLATGGQVTLNEQLLQIAGELAYELGVERGTFTIAGQTVSIDNRVTNIYRREVTGWKIVHHHTDLSPAMVEIVSRLHP